MSHTLPEFLSIAPRLVVAVLLGVLIGIERQWRQRHSGLTTHALVALGAAAYSALPTLVGVTSEVRMGSQVVTGIGFLGAGLIMRDGLSVRGLSTAATVWATGAVGVLAGYGNPLEAAELAVLIVLINLVLPRLSWLIDEMAPESKEVPRFYVIEPKCKARDEAMVRTMLLQALSVRKLRLQSLESHALPDTSSVEVEALVFSAREEDSLVEHLVGELVTPQIVATSWTSTTPPE